MISRAPSFASSDGDSRGSSPTPTANRFSICSPISADGGLFAFRRTPLFRCSDGSSYRYPGYLRGTGLAWIRRDGRFARRDTENDWLFTISGRLRGSAGAGSLRIIESHEDARGVCDTGTVGFSASRLAAARHSLLVGSNRRSRS